MTGRTPMRTRAGGPRVPGFAAPGETPAAMEPPAPVAGDVQIASATVGQQPVADYRGVPMRQFNTRLLDPLHGRYRLLVTELQDAGFSVSMTELVHAVLHEGPATPVEARAAVRRWRRVLDPED